MARPEDLTIDFRKLLRMTVRDRVAMAQSKEGPSYLASLTPTQYALLFPSYYKDQLPDMGLTKATSGATPLGTVSGEGPSDGKMPTAVPTVPERSAPQTEGKTVGSKPEKSPGVKESWQQRLMREAQERKRVGETGTAKPGNSTGLKKIRSKFAEQLTDDEIRALAALGKVETGGMSAKSKLGWLETYFNRATVRGVPLATLRSGRNKGYWGGGLGSPGKVSDKDFAEWKGMIDEIMEGSNVAKLATDNASNAPGNPVASRRIERGLPGTWSEGTTGDPYKDMNKGEFLYVDKPYLKGVEQLKSQIEAIDREEEAKNNTGEVIPDDGEGRLKPKTEVAPALTTLPEGLDQGIIDHYKTLNADEQKKLLESMAGVPVETINGYYRSDRETATPQVVREKTNDLLDPNDKMKFVSPLDEWQREDLMKVRSETGETRKGMRRGFMADRSFRSGGRNKRLHAGTDFFAPPGSAVKSPEDGIVIRAQKQQGYNGTVDILHTAPDGTKYVTRYGHMNNSYPVRVGDEVKAGTVIGSLDGDAHLHMEVRDYDKYRKGEFSKPTPGMTKEEAQEQLGLYDPADYFSGIGRFGHMIERSVLEPVPEEAVAVQPADPSQTGAVITSDGLKPVTPQTAEPTTPTQQSNSEVKSEPSTTTTATPVNPPASKAVGDAMAQNKVGPDHPDFKDYRNDPAVKAESAPPPPEKPATEIDPIEVKQDEKPKEMKDGGTKQSPSGEPFVAVDTETGENMFTFDRGENVNFAESGHIKVTPNTRRDSEEIERLAKARHDSMNANTREKVAENSTSPQRQQAPQQSVTNPNLPQMYVEMAQDSGNIYKTPSAARAFNEARFQGRSGDMFALAPANIKT